MKKLVLTLGVVLANYYSAQQSSLIINNYSNYDYHGNITATPATSCYPMVEIGTNTASPSLLIVPANSNDINGLNAYYPKYYTSGVTNPVVLYPISTFYVQTSGAGVGGTRNYNHPSLLPSGVLSSSTDWRHSKFQMYYAGTNNQVSFNGNLDDYSGSCFAGSNYISTPNGDAEMFKITSSSGQNFTYINIY